MKPASLMTRLEAGALAPGAFGHRAHLEAAFEALRAAPFLPAASRYANAIERFATAAGVPEKFNLTVTLAYLSLVAERLAVQPGVATDVSFDDFIEANPDLLNDALARYYSPSRLRSTAARQTFLLPDRLQSL